MDEYPLAETSRRFSPYTYCLNNRVYFIEPDGMEARAPDMIDIPSGLLESNEIRTDGYGRRLDGAAFDFVDYRPSESKNERNDQEDPKKRKLTPEQQKKLDQMLYEQKMAWEGFEVIYDDNPFSALGHQLSFAMPSARFSGLFSIFSKGSKATEVTSKGGMTTVGRWMSKTEYEIMKKTGQMIEGAGGQTFVSKGGSGSFDAAVKGSVYAEFQVSTNSLLQARKAGWFKAIGPSAGKAMQSALVKQGGQLLPTIQKLSPILKIK